MIEAKGFNPETGKELKELQGRMIWIEWSDEHDSMVYSFQNCVLGRYYETEQFPCPEASTEWQQWMSPHEQVLAWAALDAAKQNYAA